MNSKNGMSESEKIVFILNKLQLTAKNETRKEELNNIRKKLLLKMGKAEN